MTHSAQPFLPDEVGKTSGCWLLQNEHCTLGDFAPRLEALRSGERAGFIQVSPVKPAEAAVQKQGKEQRGQAGSQNMRRGLVGARW